MALDDMVLPEEFRGSGQRVKGISRRDGPGGKLSSVIVKLEEASHLAHAGTGHAHRHGVGRAWARQQVMRGDMKYRYIARKTAGLSSRVNGVSSRDASGAA
jgi:hypothetical protein